MKAELRIKPDPLQGGLLNLQFSCEAEQLKGVNVDPGGRYNGGRKHLKFGFLGFPKTLQI